jgi:hypothetical protein
VPSKSKKINLWIDEMEGGGVRQREVEQGKMHSGSE